MKICIFSGTSEGRELSQALAGHGIFCEVCVATEYGEMVMPDLERVKVHTGRMDEKEMCEFLKAGDYALVVDATHPFATVVSTNIYHAAESLGMPYYRLLREVHKSAAAVSDRDRIVYFNDAASCANALAKVEGNIFLTTGSKDLPVFCGNEDIRKRLIVRVLPGLESLKLCYDAGLTGQQIIAMQGPFSEEANSCVIHDYKISCLVTKESGRRGGTDTKIDAAEKCDISCFVIRAPGQEQEITWSLEKLKEQLFALQDSYEKKEQQVDQSMHVHFSLVGTGMGDRAGLTAKALHAIEDADYLFGAERMIRDYTPRMRKYPYYLAADIVRTLKEIKETGESSLSAAVLLSGDTGFYSGCSALLNALDQLNEDAGYFCVTTEVIPGISSLSALAAKCGIAYQNARIISMHGIDQKKWLPEMADCAKYSELTFFLTSGPKDLHILSEMLAKPAAGSVHVNDNYLSDLKFYIGYQLSYPDEQIWTMSAGELKNIQKPGLYCGFMVNERHCDRMLSYGWSDDSFIRGNVPMTKEEVRALSISKLKVTERSIVYDIGSGTGSVAVEIASLSPKVQVYAIETKEEGIRLIEENRAQSGVENLEVIQAMAPDGLEGLPAATHAFIGGSRGHLCEILKTLYQINPHMRVVMNAVSLDTIGEMNTVLNDIPAANIDITEVSISKAQILGGYRLMKASNPVYIFSFDFA